MAIAVEDLTTSQEAEIRAHLGVVGHPGYVSGNWYCLMDGIAATGATFNTIRLLPFLIQASVTLSELGTRVNTASSGGLFGLALYASSLTTKLPTGAALSSVMGLSTTSTGAVSGVLGANVVMVPGLYYAAALCDNTTAVFQGYNITNMTPARLTGSSSLTEATTQTTNGKGALVVTGSSYAGGFTDLTSASFTVANNNANAVIYGKVA